MTFTEAKTVIVPFGKYVGTEIDKIAYTDEGLLYLDWLHGVATYGRLKEALGVYFSDPSIKRELEEAINRR